MGYDEQATSPAEMVGGPASHRTAPPSPLTMASYRSSSLSKPCWTDSSSSMSISRAWGGGQVGSGNEKMGSACDRVVRSEGGFDPFIELIDFGTHRKVYDAVACHCRGG